MMVVGIFLGILNGNVDKVVQAGMDSAAQAVQLCFGFIGIYSMWLGLMKIAERSGIIEGISRRMEKVLRFLHEEVPHGIAAEVISMKDKKDKNIIDILISDIYKLNDAQAAIDSMISGKNVGKILIDCRV